MSRLKTIDSKDAEGKAKQLLDSIQAKMGMTPNLMRVMANSPAVLQSYLGFSAALRSGVLSATLRERIALVVAEANSCDYCLAAHSAAGKMAGLSEEERLDSRRGVSTDNKVQAVLSFARLLVESRGHVSDADLTGVRAQGYGDAEIVANVAVNIFSNYFNHVAQAEIDFPRVGALEQTPSHR